MTRGDGMSDLYARCEAYLQGKKSTLWGEAFNIIHPDGLAEATKWLVSQVEGLQSMNGDARF